MAPAAPAPAFAGPNADADADADAGVDSSLELDDLDLDIDLDDIDGEVGGLELAPEAQRGCTPAAPDREPEPGAPPAGGAGARGAGPAPVPGAGAFAVAAPTGAQRPKPKRPPSPTSLALEARPRLLEELRSACERLNLPPAAATEALRQLKLRPELFNGRPYSLLVLAALYSACTSLHIPRRICEFESACPEGTRRRALVRCYRELRRRVPGAPAPGTDGGVGPAHYVPGLAARLGCTRAQTADALALAERWHRESRAPELGIPQIRAATVAAAAVLLSRGPGAPRLSPRHAAAAWGLAPTPLYTALPVVREFQRRASRPAAG
eukprot:tig00021535_g22221.t1